MLTYQQCTSYILHQYFYFWSSTSNSYITYIYRGAGLVRKTSDPVTMIKGLGFDSQQRSFVGSLGKLLTPTLPL